jgi:hypothetical protein
MQIVNGLAISRKYGDLLPNDQENDTLRVPNSNYLSYPATRLIAFEKTTRMQRAVCHGVKITDKYEFFQVACAKYLALV